MLLISINVFEKPDFLKKQLENIKQFVNIDYCIILNCNNYMYNILQNETLEYVIVNPEIIDKKRFHGSIVNGIYSNMKYSVENLIFSHFLVLSSRCFFYNTLNDLNFFYNNNITYGENKQIINYASWHWPSFSKTLLFAACQNYDNIANSLHEGICFSFGVCQNIIHFLETNQEIKKDLFNFNHCVEEFALQTISVNYTGNNDAKGYCSLIHPGTIVNNYTFEETTSFPKNKLIYRTWR